MKRYEKLGIDLNTVEGIEKVIKLQCNDIGDKYSVNFDGDCKYPHPYSLCSDCIAERLFEEVPTKKVKRWETIKSDEDVITLYQEFKKLCDEYNFCAGCPYSADNIKGCFSRYLCEEVEVEDEKEFI